MPPIVSIVGRSKSGKTTLIEKLIKELRSRGYRVATVKHAPEGITPEDAGKDSSRHIEAGSEATAVSSADRVVFVKRVGGDSRLSELARLFGEDYDIILTEGFKGDSAPKLEVHRKQVGPPLKDIKKLIGIVTDEALDADIRQFSLDDVKGLADFLERGFIQPQIEGVSLYVNGAPLALSTFPRQVVTSVMLALVSALKGAESVKTMEIFIRRQPGQKP